MRWWWLVMLVLALALGLFLLIDGGERTDLGGDEAAADEAPGTLRDAAPSLTVTGAAPTADDAHAKDADAKTAKSSRILRGRVTTPEGVPVAQVRVRSGPLGQGGHRAEGVWMGDTDAEGAFEIKGVAADKSVWLAAWELGFQASTQPLTVKPDDRGPFTIVLPGWLRVAGRVKSSTDAEAVVTIERNVGLDDHPEVFFGVGSAPDVSYTCRTVDGRFAFERLMPGRYWVTATFVDDQHAQRELRLVEDVDDLVVESYPTASIDELLDAPQHTLRIRATCDKPASNLLGVLSFHGPDHAPDEHEVILDTKGLLWTTEGIRFGAGRTPDDASRKDGALVLPYMAPGDYEIRLRIPSFAEARTRVRVRGPMTETALEVRRTPGTWVKASWSEEDIGRWVLFTRPVGADDAAWRRILWSDARVHWRWNEDPRRAFVEAGEHEFRLWSEERLPARFGPVRIPAKGDTQTLRTTTQEGARLSGKVRGMPGSWAAGMGLHVHVWRGPNRWERLYHKEVRVDSDAYAIEGLERGRYRISFDGPGRHTLLDVRVEGADVERDLDLGPPK